MSTHHVTSHSLIVRLRSRDADAWSRFSLIYCPLVYRWARQSRLQQVDADDVVQEVFRSVSTSIDSYRENADVGSFRRWLWGITRYKLMDHFRRIAAVPQAEGGTSANERMQQVLDSASDESSIDPSFDADAWIVHRILGLMKSDFEERTWHAFWKMAVEDRSASDVANELGMSKQAVRQAKYRVLRQLRSELQDQVSFP
ncbi:RNA polymerase sigma factor [Allorhodopirellula heiligendammensis]|uniref:RNA polymerase sigma factor n=1 Tax=Allorhodopirellula heiligendammensis TaxID=2714739 RepID=A0A5C6BXM9_9BACT|nr:sigma-70 family RNA polymerase sigma factor [Allorhodopirellula heiligendammensis]TWU17053.1 RNA polymerase sigma factor [Allorhodopirellula heiligendammensis]